MEDLERLDSLLKNKAFEHILQQTEALIAKSVPLDSLHKELLWKKADAFYGLSDWENCKKVLDVVERQLKAEQAVGSFLYGKNLNYKGVIAAIEKNYAEAERYFLQAREIYRRLDHSPTYNRGSNLNNLALLYRRQERFSEALPLFAEALRLYEQAEGKESLSYSKALNNLGNTYKDLGLYEQAESHLSQALAIRERLFGAESAEYARALLNLANIYLELAYYEQTESLYKKALAILEKQPGGNQTEYGSFMGNLASFYLITGAWDMALRILLDEAQRFEQNNDLKNEHYHHTIHNLFEVYLKKQDYEQAERHLNKAKALAVEQKRTRSSDYATILLYEGQLHQALSNYSAAEQSILRAIELLQSIFKEQPHTMQLISYWHELAATRLAKNDLPGTLNCIQKALEINLKTNLNEKFDRTDFLDSLLQSQDLQSQRFAGTSLELWAQYCIGRSEQNPLLWRQQAQSLYLIAFELMNRSRQNFWSEGDKLQHAAQRQSMTEDALQNAFELYKQDPVHAEQVLLFAEQNKAQVLLDAFRLQAETGLPDSLQGKRRLYKNRYEEHKKALLQAESSQEAEARQKQLAETLHSMYQLEQTLDNGYPEYKKNKLQFAPMNPKQIQALLPQGVAAIEYFIGQNVAYAFVVKRQSLHVQALPVDIKALNAQIKTLLRVLTDYEGIRTSPEENRLAYQTAAHAVYTALLLPLREQIGTSERLIIVPDGLLHYLPFEALLTEPAPEPFAGYAALPYLLKRYSVSYAHSLQVWQQAVETGGSNRSDNGQILAMAADYGGTDSLSSGRTKIQQRLRATMEDLPAGPSEVQALSKSFEGLFHTGLDCNETAFKRLAPEFTVLHLAMHGILDHSHPLLSSLAFTEDGSRTEDNFLQAIEIASLRLNARLVVLSACETGYGRFSQGEGVLSLGRAFLSAGVPSLLVSLWEVNDQATASIMPRFYEHLSKGINKSQALRQAKLEYLEQSRGTGGHPAFWAAFVLQGDDQAIAISPKRRNIWLPVIGTAALLSVLVLILRKRLTARPVVP